MSEEDARNMLGEETITKDNMKAGENANPEDTKAEAAKETKLDSKAISLKYLI